MNPTRRTQRLASVLRDELAKLVVEETSDPALQDVVITDVSLSPDMKNARIYFTAGFMKQADVRNGFRRAGPFLRRKIGERLRLRYVPELNFEVDSQGDSVDRIFTLLHEVSSDAGR